LEGRFGLGLERRTEAALFQRRSDPSSGTAADLSDGVRLELRKQRVENVNQY
jgi:hypothetical protein